MLDHVKEVANSEFPSSFPNRECYCKVYQVGYKLTHLNIAVNTVIMSATAFDAQTD